MYSSTNGQIAIFIIISTIVIIFGIAFITLSSDFQLFEDQTTSYDVGEFVEACIDQQLERGVNEMGRQGGWIYPPESIYFANRNDEDNLVENAEGFNELSTNKIPYWHYYDDSDEKFRSNHIPPYDTDDKNSLKMQLKRYLDETLDEECLRGFSTFDEVYDIYYEEESINHSVQFGEDNIRVVLSMPVEINQKNQNATDFIEDYSTSMENKLKTPYYLARDIANAQKETSFIDRRAMQFLFPYMSKNSRELLPPTYDFDITYDPKPWMVSDVEKTMKRVLSSSFYNLQLQETKTQQRSLPEEIEDLELAQGINQMYSKYYLGNPDEGQDLSLIRNEKPDIFEEYQQYRATPLFQPFYPLSTSFTPSMGDVVIIPEANFFTGIVPLSTTKYQTAYEFHGPMVFSIEDTRNPNDDFEFRVGFEMNVEHNQPLKDNYPDINAEEIQLESQDVSREDSLVCEPSQYVSKLVKVNITDPIENRNSPADPKQGVENALVEFSCSDGIAQCSLGTTSLDENNRSDLSMRLPINCDPGTLSISKQGHKSVEIENVNPNTNNQINLGEVEMPSAKQLHLDLSLKGFNDVGDSRLRGALEEEDTGIIIFEHKNQDNFVEVKRFDKQTWNNINVSLIPGDYSIQAMVIKRDEDHVIPKEKICEGGGGVFGSEECFTLPETELPTWIRASYQNSFSISTEELLNNNIIKIDILDIGMPNSYSDLEEKSSQLEQIQSRSERPTITFDRWR